jgi:pimeloyl-ACP methyl ester carboxylesterase
MFGQPALDIPARLDRLVACAIMCCGLWLASPAAAQPNAATAPTQYSVVNGERIAYRSIGQGRPLLLATRMRGTLDTWDPLFLDALARQHTVITFDYPGIGYSSGTQLADIGQAAGFVAELATALKIERFVAAGWSWGGMVMQTLLIQHPQRVSHAVLIGTTPPGKAERPIQPVFIERALKPYNDLTDDEILFFEPASERSREANRRSRERIYARPGVADRIPSRPEQIQPYLRAAKQYHEDSPGRREALTRSKVPMLVLCGDNDISVPAQNWFPLVGRIDAQLIVLPQSGHGPQHQYPELSARYIADFTRLPGH